MAMSASLRVVNGCTALSAHRRGAGPAGGDLLAGYVPRFIPKFDILDLPLLVTIYFSVGWRNPIAGTVTGAVIGLVQDALTSRPLGINGISQCIVGFFAASLGVKIDVENPGTRLLMNFAFTLMNIGIYVFIMHHMLALNVERTGSMKRSRR